MELKVAVASTEGKTVNQHFGHARIFHIYRITNNTPELIELRQTFAACSGQQHDVYALERVALSIADCHAVIAAQIGPGAIDLLLDHRIRAFALPGPIDEAFEVLMRSRRFVYLKKSTEEHHVKET